MSINPTQSTVTVPTTLTTGSVAPGSAAAATQQSPLTQNEIRTLTDRLNQEDVSDEVKTLFTTAINEIKGMTVGESGEFTAEQKQQIEASVKDINVSPEIKALLTQSLEPGEVEAVDDKKETPSIKTAAQVKEKFHTVSYSAPKHKTLFQRMFNAINDAAKSVGKFLGFKFNDDNKSKNYQSSTGPANAVNFSKYKQPKASENITPVVNNSRPNVEVDTSASGELEDPTGANRGIKPTAENPLNGFEGPNYNPNVRQTETEEDPTTEN